MNERKRAFEKGLRTIERRRGRPARTPHLTRAPGPICAIRPSLYNGVGMLETNQILQGDSIKILNDGPKGWIDLVFADPPFNIGYLYHGYNDQRNDKDYLKFSKEWMAAVHRALKPTGSF